MSTLAFSLFVLLAWALGLQWLAHQVSVHANADLASHTETVTDTRDEEQ